MAQSNGNQITRAGGVVALALTVTSALAPGESLAGPDSASPTAARRTSITTLVYSPAVPDDPDGTCSLCDVATDANVSGSYAILEIYFEDDGQDFTGDFELTLELDDESLAYATITNASQDDQQTQYYTVNAGVSWDWTEVVEVTVEAVPD